MKPYSIFLRGLFCLLTTGLFSGCQLEERILDKHPNGVPRVAVYLNSEHQIEQKKTWWFNGGKNEIIPYKNGKPHGHYQNWDIAGSLVEEGELVAGKKEGLWKTWYKTNHLESEGKYLHGIKDDIWHYWYVSGNKMRQEFWREGKLTHNYTTWFETGKKELEHNCWPHSGNGLYQIWSEEGVLLLRYQCLDSLPHGAWERFDVSGKKMESRFYQNGLAHGEWIQYYANQKPYKIRHYENGKMHGPQIELAEAKTDSSTQDTVHKAIFDQGNGHLSEYCPDQVNLCVDSLWENGKLSGWQRHFDGNRLVFDEKIQDNQVVYKKVYKLAVVNVQVSKKRKPQSLSRLILLSEGPILQGQKQGEWTTWSEGRKIRSENYEKGKPFGEQITYDLHGKITRIEDYSFPGGGIRLRNLIRYEE